MLIRGGRSAKSFGRNCKGRKEKGGGEIKKKRLNKEGKMIQKQNVLVVVVASCRKESGRVVSRQLGLDGATIETCAIKLVSEIFLNLGAHFRMNLASFTIESPGSKPRWRHFFSLSLANVACLSWARGGHLSFACDLACDVHRLFAVHLCFHEVLLFHLGNDTLNDGQMV